MLDVGEKWFIMSYVYNSNINTGMVFQVYFYYPKEISLYNFFLSSPLLLPLVVHTRLWGVTFCVHVEVVDNRSQ